jgi:hypothetical protein
MLPPHVCTHTHALADAHVQPSAAVPSKVPGHTVGDLPTNSVALGTSYTSIVRACRLQVDSAAAAALLAFAHPATPTTPSSDCSSIGKRGGYPSTDQHSLQYYVWPSLACHILHHGTWPWQFYKPGIRVQACRPGNLAPALPRLRTHTAKDAHCTASLMMRWLCHLISWHMLSLQLHCFLCFPVCILRAG